jgi:hypothetical protein
MRSVIQFLNAKGERLAEIHTQIFAVYGNVMNRQNVTKQQAERFHRQTVSVPTIPMKCHIQNQTRSRWPRGLRRGYVSARWL